MNESLRADHSGLNKFSRRSPEYSRILSRLEDIIDKSFGALISQGGHNNSFAVDYEPIMEVVDELVGREAELSVIESYLQRRESIGPMVVTLHGLGGIGKTQLASTYFNKTPKSYSARFRLDGSSRLNFESGFLKIAKAVGLNDASSALSETLIQKKREWLNLKGNDEWLILLDNVDDPGESAEQFDVSKFLKSIRQGSVIITTRLRCLTPSSKLVRVGRLESTNALRILKNHAQNDIPQGELTRKFAVLVGIDLTSTSRLRLHQTTRGTRWTSSCLGSIWCIYVPDWGISLIVLGSLQRRVAITHQKSGYPCELPR